MGLYTGRTQHGKVFAILRQYFISWPVGNKFKIGIEKDKLLITYQKQFPDDNVRTAQGLIDGIRTLESLGIFRKLGGGWYRLIRPFEKQDAVHFRKCYFKYAAKSKKYKQMKENEMKKKDNTQELTQLGSAKTKYVYNNPDATLLETFSNQFPHRDYVTEFVFNEFTSLCPKTGQPDFATIHVEYIPGDKCIETKSLKLYFLSFRQYGSFMETITNTILENCVAVCHPKWMKITANFNARGGTLINVIAEHADTDYETD